MAEGYAKKESGNSASRSQVTSLQDAYHRTEHSYQIESMYIPGGLAIVFGLLAINPLGLVLAAAGALEMLAVFGFDGREFKKFVAARQEQRTSGTTDALTFTPGEK